MMKISTFLSCLVALTLSTSCENRKTRAEIEADFENIDRTERAEEEILDAEQQQAAVQGNTDILKTKLPDEEEEKKKAEEEKEKQKKKEETKTNTTTTETVADTVRTHTATPTTTVADPASSTINEAAPIQHNTDGSVTEGMAQ